MARLLYVWEYGADLGHVSSFLPIARELRKRGWEIIFTIPPHASNAARAAELVRTQGFEQVAAPGSAVGPDSDGPVRCYAELLVTLAGLRRADEFDFMVTSWTALITSMAPDLVVADYSITGRLVATRLGIPTVVLDNGWFAPELDQVDQINFELALYSHYDEPTHVRVRSEMEVTTRALLDRVNSVLTRHGLAPVAAMADLYRSDKLILLNYPELSPIVRADQHCFFGSLAEPSDMPVVDWPNGSIDRPKIFVYLKYSSPALVSILAALQRMTSASIVAFISGAPAQFRRGYEAPHLLLVDKPVNVPRLLTDANLVIGNAGSALTNQSLLAGVPMVLVPQWTEQQLNAKRVRQLMAGEMIDYTFNVDDAFATINRVLGNQCYLAAARAFKYRNKAVSVSELAETIVSSAGKESSAGSQRRIELEHWLRLDDYDWFYLTESDAEDPQWQLLQRHQPTARKIIVKEGFVAAVDQAARLSSTVRFVTVRQGVELLPELFVAEGALQLHQLAAHWHWNCQDVITGLSMPSTAVVCWNGALLDDDFAGMTSPYRHLDGQKLLTSSPAFSNFAPMLTATALKEQPTAAFASGYRTMLDLIYAAGDEIANIINYPAWISVRRLFIHMSIGAHSTTGRYHLLGARAAFVNRFIRFKKDHDLVTLHSARLLLEDIVAYSSKGTERLPVVGGLPSDDLMDELLIALGDKIRKLAERTPLLDMGGDESAQMKERLLNNRKQVVHLFELYDPKAYL